MNWNRLPGWATSCLLAGVSCLNGSTLVADPIEPWQGGRAEVRVFSQQQSQSGTNVDLNLSGRSQFSHSSNNPGSDGIYSTQSWGSAQAQVLGTADSLLRVYAYYGTDSPGTRPQYNQPILEPQESVAIASWSGDRIHVQPGANGTLPDSIRVGVTVTMDSPYQWKFLGEFSSPPGSVDVQIGNRHARLEGWGGGDTGWFVRSGFDSAKLVPDSNSYPGALQGKIFLDLALDAQGWSDPFDLTLDAKAFGLPASNEHLSHDTSVITLGIEDITLSDGTSLTDAGYGVTFDSGLAWPVPEPASVVSWAVAAGVVGACGMFRRRKRTRSAGAIV